LRNDVASLVIQKLHLLVTHLESKLTDVYSDSKTKKQSSITDFFEKLGCT
jgi:hypothetical protein